MERIAMPSGPMSAKSKRRYGNIKETIRKQGKSDALAEQIAVQTVDRRRAPRDENGSSREEAGMSSGPPGGAARAPEAAADKARRRKR